MAPEKRKRIGLIVPSSNTTLEVDFYRSFGPEVSLHTTRMYLDVVTRENEAKMISKGLPQAVKLLKTLEPDVILFGCTSGGALGGLDHDQKIRARIEKRTGVKTLTVLSSVTEALKGLAARKIGVFTPYIDEVNEDIRASLVGAQFQVSFLRGMSLVHNVDVGKVTPEEIAGFVRDGMDPSSPVDALFLSCTNWRAYEALPILRSFIFVPIVTSSQAAIQSTRDYLERHVHR